MQAMINASVCVDTFFLMSCLLVSYLLLRQLDGSKGRFNVPLFYIHRYLRWPELFIYFELKILNYYHFRLTPVYAFILAFFATLLVYISSGPNWKLVHYMKEGCRWNWWNYLIYVNNYVHTSQHSVRIVLYTYSFKK